jgi:hypothetical protein
MPARERVAHEGVDETVDFCFKVFPPLVNPWEAPAPVDALPGAQPNFSLTSLFASLFLVSLFRLERAQGPQGVRILANGIPERLAVDEGDELLSDVASVLVWDGSRSRPARVNGLIGETGFGLVSGSSALGA